MGNPTGKSRLRARNWLYGSAAALTVLLFISDTSPQVWRGHSSCALCGATRITNTCLGHSWSKVKEQESTEWYRQHVEAEHEHLWTRSTVLGLYNIWGGQYGVADSDRYAGLNLPSVAQNRIRLYQQIGDYDEARALFLDLRECMQTGDRKPQRRLRGTIATLQEWIDSEFAAPWPVVRERITALVAENDALEPEER